MHTHRVEVAVARLHSSCFSTDPHCCHSGQEAVGEIRMTKSLFIKLAECLDTQSVRVCVCVGERERKREERSKRQWKKDRDGGGDLSQGAGGLSRIHSGLILGYCCFKTTNQEARTEANEKTEREKSNVTCEMRKACPLQKGLWKTTSQHWFGQGYSLSHVGTLLGAFKEVWCSSVSDSLKIKSTESIQKL